MIKYKLTKEEFNALTSPVKDLYAANGDSFELQIEGGIEAFASETAVRAKNHEKTARKTAEDALAAARSELETLKTAHEEMLKGNVPKGDVAKLEDSYKSKLAKREAELNGKIAAMQDNLRVVYVDNVASSIASEISTAPELILPHIKGRLAAEFGEDGKAATRVLDSEGKPSAFSVADLKKEFLANKSFSPILKGAEGSGGSASGKNTGGSGAAGTAKIDFSKTPAQIAAGLEAAGKIIPAN